MSADRGEIVGIQYLRGVAALIVVLDHAAVTLANPKYFGLDFFNSFMVRGASGVDLFFLISGFIITWVSLSDRAEPRMTVASFFGRRFIRIVPLMWLAILSFAALRVMGRGGFDNWSTARAMVLWPVGELQPLNIWTLRYEAIFYTVFAVSMMGPRMLRPLLAVWALAPVLVALSGATASPWLRAISHPVNVEFGTGVLVGLLTHRYGRRPFEAPVNPVLLSALAGVALMVFAVIVDLRFHLVQKTLLAAIFCAPILMFGVNVACPAGMLDRAGRLLGNASYALYLFHPHILLVLATVWSKIAPGTPGWILFPAAVAISISGGLAIHLWVEQPLLRVMRGKPASSDANEMPANQ